MQSIARTELTAIEPIDVAGVKYAPGASFSVSSPEVADYLVTRGKANYAPDTTPETSEAVDAPGHGAQGDAGGETAPDMEQPALDIEGTKPKGETSVHASPTRRTKRK